jgi:hypothetical protein
MADVAQRFTIPPSKKKPAKSNEAMDVAARYLVYKLYMPGRALTDSWQLLSSVGEPSATVSRAIERRWVILREEEKDTGEERYGALTDPGRILARKARR